LATLLLAKSPSPPFAGYLNEFGGDMPSVLAAFLLLAITVAAQTTQPLSEQAQPGGTITGTVTNDDGDPIEGATLCTTYWSATGSGTSCGGAQSGNGGNFEIHVPLGEVGVFAQKQEGGYWPATDAWSSHTKGVHKLTLTSDAPSAKVTLKIGPKPGELKFSVRDKSTGESIQGFRVRWIAMDSTQMMSMEIPGPTLIPAEKDVIVVVQAQGYRRWFYINPANPSQPTVRLASGEVRELEVELEPKLTSTVSVRVPD
jgi:hypothetical protein